MGEYTQFEVSKYVSYDNLNNSPLPHGNNIRRFDYIIDCKLNESCALTLPDRSC